MRPARGTVRGMIAKDFPSLKDLPLISCGPFVITDGAGTAAGRSGRNGQARGPARAAGAGGSRLTRARRAQEPTVYFCASPNRAHRAPWPRKAPSSGKLLTRTARGVYAEEKGFRAHVGAACVCEHSRQLLSVTVRPAGRRRARHAGRGTARQPWVHHRPRLTEKILEVFCCTENNCAIGAKRFRETLNLRDHAANDSA